MNLLRVIIKQTFGRHDHFVKITITRHGNTIFNLEELRANSVHKYVYTRTFVFRRVSPLDVNGHFLLERRSHWADVYPRGIFVGFPILWRVKYDTLFVRFIIILSCNIVCVQYILLRAYLYIYLT